MFPPLLLSWSHTKLFAFENFNLYHWKYLDYEVITKVRVVNEFQSEFPRILICNLNQFTTNKSLEFLSDKRFNDNLNNIGGGGDEADLRERRYNRAMQYASYALNDSEKRALSFDIKDILVSFNSK